MAGTAVGEDPDELLDFDEDVEDDADVAEVGRRARRSKTSTYRRDRILRTQWQLYSYPREKEHRNMQKQLATTS